ncbi:UbiX family flavin prenyltransferase [Arcobacteraceae bacterium]|nr:UbiX family flavin prenyltransferase [Arcobacteraceae bacterium]
MKIIVGITGASGTKLGFKLLSLFPKNIQVFVIVSNGAKEALKLEENKKYMKLENITYFDDSNLGASISSGSFKTDGYIIVPCSMNTLAKCSIGITDTLITRVFSVMLKEKRNIVLAPREMPFNSIQLENMTKLSTLNVNVAPPVIGYYSEQQTLEDMENFIIGKWFDLLHIEHSLYKRWQGK